MSARDFYHDLVSDALKAEGWKITHDPYHLPSGRKNLFVDLGAETLVAAECEGRKIAVEIKSFQGQSNVADLESALGQYFLYDPLLEIHEPDRELYLAIPREAFADLFEEPIGQALLNKYDLRLIVYHTDSPKIWKWMPKH